MQIVGLLTALIGLIAWLIKRHAIKADDPERKIEARHEEISREIIEHDQDAANVRLDYILRKLRRQKKQSDRAEQ